MVKKYRIRQVNGSDDDTQELLRVFNTMEEAWPKLTDDELEGQNCYWWIAYNEADWPVAFSGMVPSRLYPKTGYLKRSGVLAKHRGQGLQRRFFGIRERKARQIGWNMIVSECTNTIWSANNFIKCGYELFEPKEKWAFKESMYFRKRL